MARLRFRLLFILVLLCTTLYFSNRVNISRGDYVVIKNSILLINEVMVNNRSSIRDSDGDFEDWIEIYNSGDTPVNLSGYGLTNDRKQLFLWTFKEKILEPKSYLVVWASGKNKIHKDGSIHTNFTLTKKNKVVILTSPDLNNSDIFLLEPMGDNISSGREKTALELYGYDEGTPGTVNNIERLLNGPNTRRLTGPLISHNSGFYTEGFNISLSTDIKEAQIYYTLDGSVPTKDSYLYTNSISIQPKSNEMTVVRARAYKSGYPKSEIITRSYFVNENIYSKFNIPIISLVTDPKNLFDYEYGIYIGGKLLDQWILHNPIAIVDQKSNANYNQRGKNWEREASIELIESNGTVFLSQNIGIRIHGGYSRFNNLKSLALHARLEYDNKEYFDYKFFDNELHQLSSLILRTSATDSKYAFFRDAFIQSLTKSTNLDIQNFRPVLLYINGEYYGIHNIRESYDKNYISKHYGISEEDVVIIKNPTGVAGVKIQEGITGDEMHYDQMITYIKNNGLIDNNNYDYVKSKMDVDNFIEYNILQIYCDNRDWPGNNVSVWRKRTQSFESNVSYGHDGLWRWLVFDLDYGFGLFSGVKAVQNNSLERATAINGPEWPNPPWSTFLLRSLLKNEKFKTQFINTFADRLNTIYLPENVVENLDEIVEMYYPNVMNHILRWNLHNNDFESWLKEIEVMRSFANERPKYLFRHITESFGLSGTAKIKISTNEGGSIKLNSINIDYSKGPWEGLYFQGVPLRLEAIPGKGYVFVGWEGFSDSHEKIISVNLNEDINLNAVFERIDN